MAMLYRSRKLLPKPLKDGSLCGVIGRRMVVYLTANALHRSPALGGDFIFEAHPGSHLGPKGLRRADVVPDTREELRDGRGVASRGWFPLGDEVLQPGDLLRGVVAVGTGDLSKALQGLLVSTAILYEVAEQPEKAPTAVAMGHHVNAARCCPSNQEVLPESDHVRHRILLCLVRVRDHHAIPGCVASLDVAEHGAFAQALLGVDA